MSICNLMHANPNENGIGYRIMGSIKCVVIIVVIASVFTPAYARKKTQSDPIEYVSDSWGTMWVVDNGAKYKKKVLTRRKKSMHVPMGPIGGFVRSQGQPRDNTSLKSWRRALSGKDHTWPELTVVNLVKNAPGHKCGLKVGDVIYGANGKAFTPMDWASSAGRKGSFRELGLAIEDGEANRKGMVELMVRRGTEEQIIKVQLPPGAGGFSKTYPFDCPKSAKYLESICDHLVSLQNENNGSYNNGIMGSSVVALTLLANGDSKYKNSIERATDYLNRKETMKAGCYAGWATTWQIMYQGVYLAEYFLVTGNKKVLPTIQHLVDVSCASMYNRMENKNGAYYGTFGHYINPDMDAQETVYKMTVTTAGIAWSWSLASQAGADVPTNNWDAITYHLERATGNNGGAGYCGAGGGSGSHPSVANAMLALSSAPKDRRHDDNLAKRLEFLGNPDNFGSVMINHGVCVTPFYTSSLALYRTDKKAYRAFMDYWKWFIVLTRGPDNHAIYWDMAAAGGDYKLGPDPFMNAAIGLMMAAPKQRLFTYNDGDKTKKERAVSSPSPAKPKPVRTARKLTAKKRKTLDNLILVSLKKISEIGPFKPMPMGMTFTRAKVTLKSVEDESLTFQVAGGTRTATLEWKDLNAVARGTLALYMAAMRPDNGDLQALAGICTENLGSTDAADKYYEAAGEASANKLQKLFD